MLKLITDFPLNKFKSLKAGDIKLNTKQRHLNRDTVQDAALLQNRKGCLVHSNLGSMCSDRPN